MFHSLVLLAVQRVPSESESLSTSARATTRSRLLLLVPLPQHPCVGWCLLLCVGCLQGSSDGGGGLLLPDSLPLQMLFPLPSVALVDTQGGFLLDGASMVAFHSHVLHWRTPREASFLMVA